MLSGQTMNIVASYANCAAKPVGTKSDRESTLDISIKKKPSASSISSTEDGSGHLVYDNYAYTTDSDAVRSNVNLDNRSAQHLTQTVKKSKTEFSSLRSAGDPSSAPSPSMLTISSSSYDCDKYHCPVEGCRKVYRRRNHLSRHISTHNDTPLFKCPRPKCQRGFHRKDHYEYHIRVHTGDKPFVCPDAACSRAFRQRSALNRHLKSHEREQERTCTFCKRIMPTTNDLALHLKKNHPQQLLIDSAYSIQQYLIAAYVLQQQSGNASIQPRLTNDTDHLIRNSTNQLQVPLTNLNTLQRGQQRKIDNVFTENAMLQQLPAAGTAYTFPQLPGVRLSSTPTFSQDFYKAARQEVLQGHPQLPSPLQKPANAIPFT